MTCVPFCSWYTQVTSRCWMPFSQVAEQGLHGPATHLPRRRKDSEANRVGRPASPEGPPHRPRDLGPAVRGRKTDAGRFTMDPWIRAGTRAEWVAGLLSIDSLLHAAVPQQIKLWSPTGHSPCPTCCSAGCERTDAGRVPAEALSVIMWPCLPPCPASPRVLLSAVRTAGPSAGDVPTVSAVITPQRSWGCLSPKQKLAAAALDKGHAGPGDPRFPESGGLLSGGRHS